MIQYPRFEHVVHEFGHAWGLNHQYAPGFWSLMGQRSPTNTPFMNSLEREQLGWMTFHDITSSQTASLRDFGAYGDAYRISLGGDEYFLLENHQRASIYDNPDVNFTGANGLYVLRQFTNYQNFEGNLKVETADGRFDWENPNWVIFPGTTVLYPVFKRGTNNRTLGLNDRDRLPAINPNTGQLGYYDLIAKVDEISGQIVYGPFLKGDGKDVFSLGFNPVFTPWSNPSACSQTGTLSNIGFEVLPSSSSILDIQFFIGNPVSASPSKPQDLRTSVYAPGNGDYYVRLNWAANQEPDVGNGGSYVLHRRRKAGTANWGPWSYLATASGTSVQYDDLTITTAGFDNDSLEYKIKAVDNTGLSSVFSEPARINYSRYALKIGAHTLDEIPDAFELAQNYPNPFNPATVFRYALPTDAFVTFKIFDLLGREIVTLVNREQKAGEYDYQFDASQLASGIYLYKLQAGSFAVVKRMLLLR